MNQPSITNIVIFIGGGADKTREKFGLVYWGPTKLMEMAKNHFLEHAGNKSDAYYFGYLEKKAIVKKIKKLHAKQPDLRINIVGHSRGGAVAKQIAMVNLRKKGIPVNMLIALDPVKPKISDKYKIPKAKGLRNVKTFINVFAKPKWRNGADYVALVGGQYGLKLRDKAHYFVQSTKGHGQPIPLLHAKIEGTDESPFKLLIKESHL